MGSGIVVPTVCMAVQKPLLRYRSMQTCGHGAWAGRFAAKAPRGFRSVPPRDTWTPMQPLPAGTLTFLLTDIEGSTRLWEQHPARMRGAVARHQELIAASVAAHSGTWV